MGASAHEKLSHSSQHAQPAPDHCHGEQEVLLHDERPQQRPTEVDADQAAFTERAPDFITDRYPAGRTTLGHCSSHHRVSVHPGSRRDSKPQGYGLVGALFNWVAALLNTFPMLFRSTSRMAISPTATSAMISAYSTRP